VIAAGNWAGSELTLPARLLSCCWARCCAASRRYGNCNGR